jgi:hypothetical protein
MTSRFFSCFCRILVFSVAVNQILGSPAEASGHIASKTRTSQIEACHAAARVVRRYAGLPHGLLRGIARTESGSSLYPDGWPYTIDVDGRGTWFPNRASAVRATIHAIEMGHPAIDVGCFQIDLNDHPSDFKNLDQAFDPKMNAIAAASLLLQIHRSSGSWMQAVMDYHSAQPALGRQYLSHIMRNLPPSGSFTTADVDQPVFLTIGPQRPTNNKNR